MATISVPVLSAVTVHGDDQDPRIQNLATLAQRAQTALTNNAAYLAIPSPTQAQAVAQVAANTRQIDGILRPFLNLLDTIADA